jgi:hypothetical protein
MKNFKLAYIGSWGAMDKSDFKNAMLNLYKKALAMSTRAEKIEELTAFIDFLAFELKQRKNQREVRLDN